MAKKKFKISYLSVEEENIKAFSKALIENINNSLSRNDAIFYLTKINRYVFCLNKIDTKNISKIGNVQSKKETKIKLEENEGLLNKAYFAFDGNTGSIAMQNNGIVCHVAAFSAILNGICRTTMPIMLCKADRELQINDNVLAFDICVGFKDNCPDTEIDSLMNQGDDGLAKTILQAGKLTTPAKGQKVSFKLSLGKNAKHREEGVFGKQIKSLMNEKFARYFFIEKAKMTVLEEDDEGIDPGLFVINLMGTPQTKEIEITMEDNGRYPVEDELTKELEKCL